MVEPVNQRLHSVDVLRGLAIAGVVLFHLVWDLDFSGLLQSNLPHHPAWRLFGRVLAGTFMVLVGVSLVLAHGDKIRWQPFFKRLWIIIAAAAAISLATLIIFPKAFIYFGILHAIATASMIGIVFVPLPAASSLVVGLAILTLPLLFSASVVDARWLAWVGFAATPPVSNDYVPIFPWVGLTLVGLGAAKAAVTRRCDDWVRRHEPTGPITMALGRAGRLSLPIYLLHQPILLAVIVPMGWLLT